MRHVLLTLPLTALLLAAIPAAPASAAGGGISFVECLTGKRPVAREPRTPRAGGCRVSQTAALDGEGTGMNALGGLAASPDGRSLYAVSPADDAIAVFSTRPLRLRECLTVNAHLRKRGRQPCRLLPRPGGKRTVSGFDGVHFVTVSPDGRSVYTVAGGSIGTFARARSGKLTYKGCITGDASRFGSARGGACRPIATATGFSRGLLSGLGGPTSLAISPDGRFAYVALGGEGGVATLARARDGSLRFQSCLIGREPRGYFGDGATSPCPTVTAATVNPNSSGLAMPQRLAISADGRSLYASSPRRAAIAEFRRDPATGALTYQGCLGAADRDTGPGDPCRYVPQATELGWGTGMAGIEELALSRDGTALFGLSPGDEAVAGFVRDPATGTLAFASATEVSEPRGLALSADGHSVLVASSQLAAIDRFAVVPGADLRFAGCLTGGRGATGPCSRARAKSGKVQRLGFAGLGSLAFAAGDLYASAGGGSALSRFRVR